MSDVVLDEMARELRDALIRAGQDPSGPPTGGEPPPTAPAWAEYRRRGGRVYTEPEAFIGALIRRVGTV